ncbi:MAG: DUF4198 domain-containing protein [bacterium]
MLRFSQLTRKYLVRIASKVFLILLYPTCSQGHEAWVQPTNYQISTGSMLTADIRVGQMFKGTTQIYNPERFVVLDVAQGEYRDRVRGRLGDLPAIVHPLKDPGLYIIGYQSSGSTISYSNWEKFSTFIHKEGLDWVLEQHKEKGFPENNFDEVFYRHAKSVVSWRSPQGEDVKLGLPFEIVLLGNPYMGTSTSIEVEVLWRSQPYTAAQLAVFKKSKNGVVIRTNYRTDSRGRTLFPIQAGHQYLLSSVYMEPRVSDTDTAVWNSHWASFTFEVPYN